VKEYRGYESGVSMQGYGMTEVSSISFSLGFAKEAVDVKAGSIGSVVRNTELKIVDLQTSASLPRNKAGEICIRGNQIMKGKHFFSLSLILTTHLN